jgi:4-hydroxy-tetrahydrodipicolinate reductase
VTRAVVTGAGGRMGSQIIRLIAETDSISLAGAAEQAGHLAVGRDAGEVAGIGPVGVRVVDRLEDAVGLGDVVIDFTSAVASMAHLDVVCRTGKAIVIGSTGFDGQQRAEIERRSPETRVFMAPNMSLGLNVVLRVVQEVVRLLGDGYDVEILETHHRFKKDAPSGTALALAEAVAAAAGRNLETDGVYGRRGLVGERRPREIGIHAVRAGDVVGDHTVIFGGLGERVEVTHRVSSRETFARGALRAAVWLPSQPRGLYGMKDLLGLE